MTRRSTVNEQALIRAAVARLRAGILAIVCGLLAGTGLFLATVWLVLQGGEVVGPHLGLLRYYLPGYSVTWTGAFVGFIYGVLLGALVGGLTGWIYNRVVDLRHPRERTS
jgi:hypothetical protein